MSGIYVHFLPSRSEIRFTKCFRRELDRPIYQVPDRTCPTKGFFGDTKVLGDAVQDAKRKRATRKVPSMSFYPDFIMVLSKFYPDFIQICLATHFIQILSIKSG